MYNGQLRLSRLKAHILSQKITCLIRTPDISICHKRPYINPALLGDIVLSEHFLWLNIFTFENLTETANGLFKGLVKYSVLLAESQTKPFSTKLSVRGGPLIKVTGVLVGKFSEHP